MQIKRGSFMNRIPRGRRLLVAAALVLDSAQFRQLSPFLGRSGWKADRRVSGAPPGINA